MGEYGGPQQHAHPCHGGRWQSVESHGPHGNQVSLRLDDEYRTWPLHGR